MKFVDTKEQGKEIDELVAKIAETLKYQKLSTIMMSITVVVEFLNRHAGLDIDDFNRAIEIQRELMDNADYKGYVTTMPIKENGGPSN